MWMLVWSLENGWWNKNNHMNNKIEQLVAETKALKRVPQIRNFKDLEVYQVSYNASIIIMLGVIPSLPPEEKFDLKNQLSRSCKAIPRLIAEGFAKRHQNKGFQKYLDDAMAESNETQVGLTQCRDLYAVTLDKETLDWLICLYERISKQLYRTRENWQSYKSEAGRG